jgi:hypothetical protein
MEESELSRVGVGDEVELRIGKVYRVLRMVTTAQSLQYTVLGAPEQVMCKCLTPIAPNMTTIVIDKFTLTFPLRLLFSGKL